MGRYKVFDLETETHTKHKRKANPFLKENWVVARGWKNQGDAQCSWTYHPTHDRSTYLAIEPDVMLLVGFNIKFDLLYEMCQKNPDLRAFFKRGGKIWDCQYVEYLIRAQHPDAQMCAMTDIAPKYGGTHKIDEVKVMWDAGVKTSEIPEDLLIDYLVGTPEEGRNAGDIGNTEKIFLGQLAIVLAQKQLLMIEDRHDGLLCTTDMEFNGVKIDVAEAGRRLVFLNERLAVAEVELAQYIPVDLPFVFNWQSPIHKSALFFGGTVKYQRQDTYIDETTGQLARLKATEAQYVQSDGSTGLLPGVKYLSGKRKGEYKTKQVDVPGELKVKFQDFFHRLPGYTQPVAGSKSSLTDGLDGPVYGTGKEVIEELTTRKDVPFLVAFSKRLTLYKEIGTYYLRADPKDGFVGMLTCVQPDDHMLHHKLNHTSTITTRMSASDPNLQNVTRADFDKQGVAKSEVKKMFISRFTEAYCVQHGLPYHIDADGVCRIGVVMEADYSQLEVVVQGVLSGDENLCHDLREKIDFHCKRVAAKTGCTYEYALDWCKNEDHALYSEGKYERFLCKTFSFQRAYGAGANGIANSTGMSVEEVEKLIAAEDLNYPGVVVFNAGVESAVLKSAQPFKAANDAGEWKTYRRGYWQAPTGTLYSWRTYDSPAFMQKRGVMDSFSPPELKNYPVQGTGGEFVQAVLGLLFRHFLANDNYGGRAFLVNTVHDCVWFDCHSSVVDQVAADIKRIMESIPEFYNARHGMQINVPFPVEVETGQNMLIMKHHKPAALALAA